MEELLASMGPKWLLVAAAVSAVFKVISAFVPDGKWPGGANGIVAQGVNFLAFNVLKAKNDPSVN